LYVTAGLVLVTDAMAAMGLKPGEHRIGEITVYKDGKDKVVVAGTETLAGRYVARRRRGCRR